jgi:hypothetical protein
LFCSKANSFGLRAIVFVTFLFVMLLAFSVQALDHSLWQNTLNKACSKEGLVNYRILKEDSIFKGYIAYIKSIRQLHISQASIPEQKAFWINAYNALTVQLVLDHYPIKSIKDISNAWDRAVLTTDGKKYSLNDIEHKILFASFFDLRMHAALVCAAHGCPRLHPKAFTAENIDLELSACTNAWINDSAKNNLEPRNGMVYVSKIFEWYEIDFKKEKGVPAFIAAFLPAEKKAKLKGVKIRYLEYDWSLNDASISN